MAEERKKHTFEIVLAGHGADPGNSIVIDGVDLTGCVRKLSVGAGVGELATLHVDFLALEVLRVRGVDADVIARVVDLAELKVED